MFENIRLAFQGIWSHKMRSVLTMLGIIIGIAAIITIVSTIKGTNEEVLAALEGYCGRNGTFDCGLDELPDDYMTKPFSPSELVARVKAHMSRYNRLVNTSQKQNDVIEIRGIRIDKTARRVYIDGEEKNFTTKEFDLLTLLAENPNHVYTKEELFREIWDMDSIGDIATVTVHIKKIREKIEFDTANPQYIETIWGVGYRFKV